MEDKCYTGQPHTRSFADVSPPHHVSSHNGIVGRCYGSHFTKGENETQRAEAPVSEISDVNSDLSVLIPQLLSSSLFSIPGKELVTLLSCRPKDSWKFGGSVSNSP